MRKKLERWEMERELARLKPQIVKAVRSIGKFVEFEHEDLVAVAMIRVWKDLETGGDFVFRGKCRALARWAAQDYLRQNTPGGKRNPVRVASLNVLEDETRVFRALQLPSLTQSPEDAAIESSDIRLLRVRFEKFKRTLKKRDRWVLERLAEGKTKTQIAEMLGVTQPRITQIAARLRKKLRDQPA